MIVHHREGQRPIKMWLPLDEIEDQAYQQLDSLSKMRFVAPGGIAVMPDIHWGVGTSVGTVIPTVKAVIPAAVGVDLGCGMAALRLNLRSGALPTNLSLLRMKIEQTVRADGSLHMDMQEGAAWYDAESVLRELGGQTQYIRAMRQLGTLGGGNHFVELCIDEEDVVWIVLHSGSRGVGNLIGRTFINRAKEMVAKWDITLPDANLAWLPEDTPEFSAYMNAVEWAQAYATANRTLMLGRVHGDVQGFFGRELGEGLTYVNCHHNYVTREHHGSQNVWITRKGAIRARLGDMGIIPGSMGTPTYIVRGRGVAESYHSCAHGAGRAMSRKAARERFTVEDLISQTSGVECRKDGKVLDEIPGAYKDINEVMRNQEDLVEIVHTLKQVLNVKGV